MTSTLDFKHQWIQNRSEKLKNRTICFSWTNGLMASLDRSVFTRHSCTTGTAEARISYGNSVCPSVRPSVRLSRHGTDSRPGEIETPALHHMIA